MLRRDEKVWNGQGQLLRMRVSRKVEEPEDKAGRAEDGGEG